MTPLRENLAAHPQVLVVCTGNICRSPMGEIVLREALHARASQRGSASEAEESYDRAVDPYAQLDVSFKLASIIVASAGVSTEEHGNPIYPPAARILASHGYPVPAHRAHQATPTELRSSGLILAMTTGHARSLRSMCERIGVDPLRIYLWREFEALGDTSPASLVIPAPCFAPDGYLGAERSRERAAQGSNFYSYDDPRDVPDPWYSGDFNETLDIVEAGARGIVNALEAALVQH